MRFGAVSSQLLALGSQLNYSPYRKEDAQTLLRIQQKLVEKLLFQAQKEISFNTSGRKEADFSTA